MTNPLMITGPTGSGKTKIAFELARRHGGEVVNLDRTYIYRDFKIVTGMQDAIKEPGVKRHLYEFLDPAEPSFSCAQFIQLVNRTVREVGFNNKLAIAEGGSTKYIPALLEHNRRHQTFNRVVGIRATLTTDYIERYKDRINKAFNDGLVEEISARMHTYQQSFLIKDCHFAIPTVKYINGELTLAQSKIEILDRCLDYFRRQVSMFEKFTEVQWIDGSDTLEAVKIIEGMH